MIKKPICLEIRIFPDEIAQQLTEEDLRDKSIFDLVNELPTAQVKKVKYGYYSRFINKHEAEEMNLTESCPVLVRKSTCYNEREKPIMLSRFITPPDQMDLEFIFEKTNNHWQVVSKL